MLPSRARRRSLVARAAALLGLVAPLGACGDADVAPPARALLVGEGGRVVGTCRLAGTPRPVRLREWPAMGIEGGRDDESVDAGDGRALGGCVVTLEPLAVAPPAPPAEDAVSSVELTAAAGRFAPHVAVVRAPAQVVLENRLAADLVVHAFDATTGTTVFNLAVGPGSTMRDIESLFLDRPGVYRVTDDPRGHFTAWVHVVASPYVALTRSAGRGDLTAGGYRFDRVPPGRHVVRCWHEPMDRREREASDRRFGGYVLGRPIEVTRTVEVAAGRTAQVDFEIGTDGGTSPSEGR